MKLSDIASVSGKGGLFKILKPTRNGVILESLDEKRAKLIAYANQRVSSLHEISIYTTTQEGSVDLEHVLRKIWDEFKDDPGIDSTSTAAELRSFMAHIVPDHDQEKVYDSDIKRLVSWYRILLKEAPEILNGTAGEDGAAETTATEEKAEPKAEKKSKKAKSKKAD